MEGGPSCGVVEKKKRRGKVSDINFWKKTRNYFKLAEKGTEP
jgi:hypothetical protein